MTKMAFLVAALLTLALASTYAQETAFPGHSKVDLCKQCCAKGSHCPAICLPCEPHAFNPCSRVRCAGPCVVRNGKAVCLPSPGPWPVRLGQCPVNDLLPRIFCPVNAPDQCSGDKECSRGEKCCRFGCARRCIAACFPPCKRNQQCKVKTRFVCERPGCPPQPETATCKTTPPSPTNPCDVRLCLKGTRCEVQGKKAVCVPISVTRPGVCPRNDQFTTCLASQRRDRCRSDAECEAGEKCCSRGCGRSCVSACPTPCGRGQQCVLEHFVTCLAIGCPLPPPPRAVCRRRNGPGPGPLPVRDGQCPRDTLITTCQVREDACFSDVECPPGERCCSRGCGRACSPVCLNCSGPDRECVLQQVQCVRAPCPPLPLCRRRRPLLKLSATADDDKDD